MNGDYSTALIGWGWKASRRPGKTRSATNLNAGHRRRYNEWRLFHRSIIIKTQKNSHKPINTRSATNLRGAQKETHYMNYYSTALFWLESAAETSRRPVKTRSTTNLRGKQRVKSVEVNKYLVKAKTQKDT